MVKRKVSKEDKKLVQRVKRLERIVKKLVKERGKR